MAWTDVFEGAPGGILAGVAIAVAAPVVLPLMAVGARPLAKGLVKGYLALSESVKEATAESCEKWNDLVAEARAEREAAHHGAAAPQAPSAPLPIGPEGQPMPQG